MAETTNVSKLIINYLTEDQYKTAKASGLINENELYVTDVQDSTTLDCFEELFTATEGQTLFTLTEGTYQVGESRLTICVNGAQQPSTAYTETSSSSFTFVSGLHAGDSVIARYFNSRITSNITLDGTNIVITGYSKPASKTPLVATDRVDEALGKLEAGVDINTASISGLNADVDFNVTNLVTNGDFSNGTTGWSIASSTATISASSNILSITGSGTSASPSVYQTSAVVPVSTNKYYMRMKVMVSNASCQSIKIYVGDNTIDSPPGFVVATINTPALNQWYDLTGTLALTTQAGFIRFYVVSAYADAATANGKVTQIQYGLSENLTAAFGAGNEPTAAQMDAILAQFPNSWFNGTSNIAKGQYMAKRAIESYFPITNLVTNGNFSNGTTGWAGYSSSISVANNVLSATGTGSTYYPGTAQTTNTPCVNGHKIYFKASVSVTNAFANGIECDLNGSTGGGNFSAFTISSPLANTVYTRSAVVTLSAQTGYIKPVLISTYADAATANGKVLQVQYVLAIDLTSAFGAGNEPTAAQMDAMLAFYPNSWFDGTANLASNPKMLPYLLNSIRNLNLEKTSYGVYSGLGVTQQSTPDMTIKVATGTIYMDTGARFTPAANTALAITAADATNPRIDIVYVNSAGVISYLTGTAAASPSVPAVPTGGQKLAEISVAANATTIVAANITDKRRMLASGEAWITPTMKNGWVSYSAFQNVQYMKDSLGFVHLRGLIKSGTMGSAAFTFPSGYRTSLTTQQILLSAGAVGDYIIDVSGNFIPNSGTNTYFALDGISFRAEA